jgi:hypothetical protein
MKKTITYLFLSLLAKKLQGFFSPFSWIYAVIRIATSKDMGWQDLHDYFENVAVSYDQMANAENGVFFNDIMITKMSLNIFGFPDETLSSVFGKNKRVFTLTKFGSFWAWLLNKIEINHVEMSIEEDEGSHFEK